MHDSVIMRIQDSVVVGVGDKEVKYECDSGDWGLAGGDVPHVWALWKRIDPCTNSNF